MKALIVTENNNLNDDSLFTCWATLYTETKGFYSFYNVVKYFYESLKCDDFLILWETGNTENMKAHYEKHIGQ